MDKTIDAAIKKMAEQCQANAQSDQAMKYSQAALNLAHVKSILFAEARERKTKGTGS